MPYLRVKDIDFSSPKNKKRALDHAIDESQTPSTTSTQSNPAAKVQPPNEKELKAFCATLSQCGTKPVILSLIPEYASNYVPKSRLSNFPKPLQSLSDNELQKFSFPKLLDVCNKVNLEITEVPSRTSSSCQVRKEH